MFQWNKETDFTTINALHNDLSNLPSRVRIDPRSTRGSLSTVDRSHTDTEAGKDFFELKDYSIFDLMGTVLQPNLEPHYDHITPYLGKINQQFREVEIVAVTETFAYITAVQRVDGTAADGSLYDMSYRLTSLVRKMPSQRIDTLAKRFIGNPVSSQRKW
ncbi:hypothetical protein COCVIDRAFT_14178 [Bipolaris victoriae FI3]|uniref:Uncharacterized protein n=1 Tax=Bipolaris victoriae (strain FI3) TaxID=930091 RepID=W7EZ15_BIPV3|nr:hypothetical protein COCVIDRAFT_14178 [Bipolaris victoriae FI3]